MQGVIQRFPRLPRYDHCHAHRQQRQRYDDDRLPRETRSPVAMSA